MMEKILLLSILLNSVNCETNILPKFNPTEKVIDCMTKAPTGSCEITLVVNSLTSMTYYNFTSNSHPLRGFRAYFNSGGDLVVLSDIKGFSNNPPPTVFIQTDGCFRSLITVNGQMPGPTIIAHENQTLIITVYNQLENVEGITIHWHGMYQRGTQEADGVAYITQYPIPSNEKFTYDFHAYPAGTYWYHAHSGAQRSDGLYGAFIVRDVLPGNLYDFDLPDQHTLLLMDWQRESSIDLFHSIDSNLGYWKESSDGHYIKYNATLTSDKTEVGPMPFWSGIINDKGRHYDEFGHTNIKPYNLNYFNVSKGNRYRFRLIGAQALYAFKFSIQNHTMTVVATDGIPIVPIEDVDYVIVYPGERYDVIVNANVSNATPDRTNNFWIWAETLEDANIRNETFYTPLDKHRAEAILHYDGNDNIVDNNAETKSCSLSSKCQVVNCPFKTHSESSVINCINVDDFRSLSNHTVPEPNKTLFYNFGFDGEITTSGSSIDGINFQLPGNPPLVDYAAFNKSNDMCPNRGCDHNVYDYCACTQVIDISDQMHGSVVELVLSNRLVDANETNPNGSAHPIHLHGHSFYVVKIGYPNYSNTNNTITNNVFETANDDIECINSTNDTYACPKYFITVDDPSDVTKQTLRWRNMASDNQTKRFAKKDTVVVPFGGYTVIRFIVDNPGWWFLHCHIEIHQLSGMAAVVRELPNELPTTQSIQGSQISSMHLGSSSLMIVIALLAVIGITCM